MHLPSSDPPGPETILMHDPGRLKFHNSRCSSAGSRGDHWAAFLQALIPAEGALDRLQHSASLPGCTAPPGEQERKGGRKQKLETVLRQGTGWWWGTPLQMPLREIQLPPVQYADGPHHQPLVAYYFQPSSSTDTLNWQRHIPPCWGGATSYDQTIGDYFSNPGLQGMT